MPPTIIEAARAAADIAEALPPEPRITFTPCHYPRSCAHGHVDGARRYVHINISDPTYRYWDGGCISGYVSEAVFQRLNELLSVDAKEVA